MANNSKDRAMEFGEAAYELSDNPKFELLVEMENMVKQDLMEELSRMDQPTLLTHGATMSGIIQGIIKIQEYREVHKAAYLNEKEYKDE